MIRLPILIAVLLCLTGRVHAAVIEGRVNLPPAQSFSALRERYEVPADKPVLPPDPPIGAVYLEGASPLPGGSGGNPEMKQQGYQFRPGLLIVQKGTTVAFPNLDDDYHNILSYSKAKRFDLGRYRKDEAAPAVLFDQPGLVKVYCEIHEHMQGTVLVVDTPHFTATDADGNYRLENLPTGSYVLKAWTGRAKLWEKPVELHDGETLRVDFTG